MKLIISELEERSRYTSREAAYIIRELIDNYGWKQIETEDLYYSSSSLKSLLLSKLTELPEVILCWEGYYLNKCAQKRDLFSGLRQVHSLRRSARGGRAQRTRDA
jgi:hypothetical protein